ncbi:MAG: response regulator [Gemmatimonadaceae bacterium]|nr:response regulator [Gemmatimonadaceae bacterium]
MSESSVKAPASDAGPGPRRGKILLVDDREENLDAFEAILAPLGHGIVRASSSADALRFLLKDDFAVVLLDVRMPGTDGVETARLIKARIRSRSTPIIFITALDANRRQVTEAYASGAVDYLFKPVDPDVLRAKVEAFVQLYEKREQLAWQERRRYADLVAQESEERLLADRLRARQQVDSVRRDISSILESISDPFVVYDSEWRFRYVNRAAARVFSEALSPVDESVIGQRLWDVFPSLRGAITERELALAMVERRTRSFEHHQPQFGWTEIQIYPTDDGGLAVVWKNISGRKRAEHSLRFLNEASEILGSSLDFEETLRSVARLAVPGLADWCGVDIVGEDGVARQLAVEHSDPAKVSLARELRARYPEPADAPAGLPHALRTGESQFFAEITDEQFVTAAQDPEHLALLRGLDLKSIAIVPFVARGRIFGALTIGSGAARPRLTHDDLTLVEALARRAAVAIDNARLFQEAQRARAEAETANKAKSDFLATMSHELRTPLNAIAGYTELLELELRGPVTDEQREDLRRIRRSQRHLLALVNDVLNFARLDTGHLHYDIRSVDLEPLLHEVETMIAPQLTAKGLIYELSPLEPGTTVRADPEKLQQILLNLLSNALKFTSTGGHVRIACARSDTHVAISVSDTGRGIAEDQHKAIFEPFVQVDRSLTRESEGSGLGLAISRELAIAMQGDLSVSSELGAGSVFTLTLPAGGVLPDARP